MENLPEFSPRNPEETDLIILDRSNPMSVLGLLPTVAADSIEACVKEIPKIFEMDETELYAFMRSNQRTPTPTDNRLRLSFWIEYNRSLEKRNTNGNFSMKVENIYAGICSKEYFYKRYLLNAWKVSWLLIPPTDYSVKMEEALDFGIDQMRAVLSLDHEPFGRTDYKLITLKKEIVKMLELRVKGAVVQRVDSRNINIDATPKQARKLMETMTTEEIEERIKQIEKRDKRDMVEGFRDPGGGTPIHLEINKNTKDSIDAKFKSVDGEDSSE